MNSNKLIETYPALQAGFQAVLIQDSWQVAQLNYSSFYDLNHFDHLVARQKSDRSLSLLNGKAVLLTIDKSKDTGFKMRSLQQGSSYNIPRNKPHRILMTAESQILVVEQANQHLEAPQKYLLNAALLKEIRQNLHQVLKP